MPGRVVLAEDREAAHVIVAIAGHFARREHKAQVHAMLVLRAVIVKARPRTGWKQGVTHNGAIISGWLAVKDPLTLTLSPSEGERESAAEMSSNLRPHQ